MSASEQRTDASLPRRRARRNPPSAVSVRIRPQTPEEERQFNAAFRLFLIEIVRQQLERPKAQP